MQDWKKVKKMRLDLYLHNFKIGERGISGLVEWNSVMVLVYNYRRGVFYYVLLFLQRKVTKGVREGGNCKNNRKRFVVILRQRGIEERKEKIERIEN